jgi:hypothetical protein
LKALAVYPGQPNSMHLREVDGPHVTDIPEGRGVLVRVLRVGVDGTDKEINAAQYGDAPDGRAEVRSDVINQSFVLGNKVMVGSVNVSPDDFARGRDDLVKATAFYPGWLEKLLTTRVPGLASYQQMLRELTENQDAIKVFVEVGRP